MNPLTNEELIAKCKAITTIFDPPSLAHELLSRFEKLHKLTQPEQVSGELTEKIVEAVMSGIEELHVVEDELIITGVPTSMELLRMPLKAKLRTAIQTALNKQSEPERIESEICYPCRYCEKVFTDEYELEAHVNFNHNQFSNRPQRED